MRLLSLTVVASDNGTQSLRSLLGTSEILALVPSEASLSTQAPLPVATSFFKYSCQRQHDSLIPQYSLVLDSLLSGNWHCCITSNDFL